MGPADSPRISRVLGYSGVHWASVGFRVPGCHRLWLRFPSYSANLFLAVAWILLPHSCRNTGGLGCSAFARHYLRNHFCFLLLWVLRCFSSPRSPSLRNDWPSTSRVAPFGNLGIKGYLHLPQAYRSLSRPSSPPRAKASTVCPCLLSLSLTLLPFIAKIEARVGLIYLQLALFFCYFTFLKLSNTSKIFFYPLRSLSWRITDSNR